MRAYRNEFWDMLGKFFIGQIAMVIPIMKNQVVDSLATIAGNFKVPIYSKKKYKIEYVNRPSIPKNSKYWKAFEDDFQIKRFLEFSNELVNTNIDTKNHDSENIENDEQFANEDIEKKKLKNMTASKDIIQLKGNYIPKGLIPLEKIFDQNDVAKDPKVQPNENEIQYQNIGIEDSPKIVELSKNFPAEEKKR